jgi:hypothetical protein
VSTSSSAHARRDSRLHLVLLDSLRPVVSAAWNAPSFGMQTTGADVSASAPDATVSMCAPGTRVAILNDLLAWADSLKSPCVFWLNGLAGTGKSTIARTLCSRLHGKGLLGASFFISRDQPDKRDASNIVRSIAHQLAVRQHPVSDALCAKLRETPLSAARSLQEQITDFIIDPARGMQGSSSLVIVIDALDEALADFLGRPGGDFLLLLARQMLHLDGRLRLCLTSRNEITIQNMFRDLSLQAKVVVKLHDLDTAVVRGDITTFLTLSFNDIRNARAELALDGWPSSVDIDKLAELSGLLFIYAATAVRFVNNRKYSPRRRLAELLGRGQTYIATSPYAQLDGLYRQILSDAVQDSDGDESFLCQRLQTVMAVVVLAQTPLNIGSLATLSGLDPDDVGIAVYSLTSLLAESTSVVRVFHPSFPEFVIDAARCTDDRLRVVPAVDHGIIALRCLELMNQNLRYDICDLRDPTVANDDVSDLNAKLHESVQNALQYAACFWCAHLAACTSSDDSLLDVLDKFCQKHLFHWVEILSLVKSVPLAETALLRVIEWCEVRRSDASHG